MISILFTLVLGPPGGSRIVPEVCLRSRVSLTRSKDFLEHIVIGVGPLEVSTTSSEKTAEIGRKSGFEATFSNSVVF